MTRTGRPWLAALLVVLALGALLRLTGLETKGISHPESYIPGIDLPARISEPPPRHGLVETAVWHFRDEPHPFGYYLAMWMWVQVFGASLLSIRVPEAILGTISIYLLYRVGKSAYNPQVGVIAAALLSVHGFHTFWSQAARMYAPGAFLGLLSTVLLFALARSPRARPWVEAAYVLTTVAGTMTVEFFWPLLAIQVLWVALRHPPFARGPSRTAVVQALACICSAPMLSHAVMLGRNNAAPPPSLAFLFEYFSFGFLFQHGAYSDAIFELPFAVAVAVALLSVVLLRSGLRFRSGEDPPVPVHSPPPRWPLAVAALGSATTMLGIALVAPQRNEVLALLSTLPLAMLLIPEASRGLRPTLARVSPQLERVLARGGTTAGLVALLALGPTLALFAVSNWLTLTAARAFLQFVPYLVLLVAAGTWPLARRPIAAAALAATLGVLFAGSVVVLRQTPTSTRDYQGLADTLGASIRPGDRVFAPPRHWAYTAMFFYLDHRQLVATDYASALHIWPRPRVWVLATPPDTPLSEEVADALSDYQIVDRIEARGLAAVLYQSVR